MQSNRLDRFVLLWLFVALPVVAGAAPSPQAVTAPEVKHMLEQQGAALIHALSKIEYDIQHIPGSINIPAQEMGNSGLLPEDKDRPLIFYCMGKKCPYSKMAAEKALDMGYRTVFWFQGGIPEWYRFGYPMQVDDALTKLKVKKLKPATVMDLLQRENPLILDVRPAWWQQKAEVMIEGSVFIPLTRLHQEYRRLPKDRRLIVTDELMKQSPSAARFLLSRNYTVLGVMKGGIARWRKEGMPVQELAAPATLTAEQ